MSITRSKRASTAGYVQVGQGKISRPCPVCHAAPQYRCGRNVGIYGWVTMKTYHKGR
jgi:hypothetical protein